MLWPQTGSARAVPAATALPQNAGYGGGGQMQGGQAQGSGYGYSQPSQSAGYGNSQGGNSQGGGFQGDGSVNDLLFLRPPFQSEIPNSWKFSEVKYLYDILLGKMLQPEPRRADDREVPYLRAHACEGAVHFPFGAAVTVTIFARSSVCWDGDLKRNGTRGHVNCRARPGFYWGCGADCNDRSPEESGKYASREADLAFPH